jgi:hypothetical protein
VPANSISTVVAVTATRYWRASGLRLHVHGRERRARPCRPRREPIRPRGGRGAGTSPPLPRAATHALLLKAGVPVHVVAQRLGHSSPVLTLSIYSHVLAPATGGSRRCVREARRSSSLQRMWRTARRRRRRRVRELPTRYGRRRGRSPSRPALSPSATSRSAAIRDCPLEAETSRGVARWTSHTSRAKRHPSAHRGRCPTSICPRVPGHRSPVVPRP